MSGPGGDPPAANIIHCWGGGNSLGCVIGGNVFGWTADEQQSFDVLDRYVDAGGNFIDTADLYSAWAPGHAGGESETIIGRWMAARGLRNRIVIATKVGMAPGLKGLSPRTIRTAADASLGRLGVTLGPRSGLKQGSSGSVCDPCLVAVTQARPCRPPLESQPRVEPKANHLLLRP